MTTVRLTTVSGNRKTGPIPVSITEESSCPRTCPFLGQCYASFGHTALHWRSTHKYGVPWSDFVQRLRGFPRKQLWRHNEAGDLPHRNGKVNRRMMLELAQASKRARGFTYTHHVLDAANVETFRRVHAVGGFTINASCETEAQADAAIAKGLPAVIVRASTDPLPKGATTPGGAPLRQCPAEQSDITCARCGICARVDRKTVIVFHAHGNGAKRVNNILAQVTG